MAKIIETNEFDKEVLQADIPVIVDFFAEWCGPCKMLGPILQQFSEEMSSQVKVIKVDIDKSGELASRYGIVSVPTLILFKNGKQDKKVVGVQSIQQLKQMVE